ncbi:hypothetical protein SeMB42_g01061 [Synchytrium endobioticum]|uniref:Protein kinase domain-containing protein n=1 Tax=Synchytrium endobioticum TaxID=286115 RepID=A0A507D8K2_9FUNG|nr:hypothetical protein SeLEV6574_g02436 [Synchytrium endobioticum]TPX53005.1 hypothetical protein SeMB42_g01061 [Synchytrium endobioticum]
MTNEACAKLGEVIGIRDHTICLVDIIGTGSFSVVYGGESRDGALYAVKTISKNSLTPQQLSSQRREALFLKTLQHDNIARLYDVIEDSNYLYLIMERAQTDLYEAITSRGGFSVDVSKNIFDQICSGLLYSHDKGIYHRDIKPENILISDSRVKLTDFGLATRERYSTELGCGSVRYMAPECLGINNSRGYCTAANDVWSMGVILINLLFGKNPWHEASATDPIFGPYISRAPEILREQFNLSHEFDSLLRRVFTLDARKRITLKELRRAVAQCNTFTFNDIQDDVGEEYGFVFESDDLMGGIASSRVTSASSNISQPDDMNDADESGGDAEDATGYDSHSTGPPDHHLGFNNNNNNNNFATTAVAPPPSPAYNDDEMSLQQQQEGFPWNLYQQLPHQRHPYRHNTYNVYTTSSSSSSLSCKHISATNPSANGDTIVGSWADDFAEMDFSNPPFTIDNHYHNYDFHDATAAPLGGKEDGDEVAEEYPVPHQRKASNAFSIATHDSGFEDMTVDGVNMLDDEIDVDEESEAKPASLPGLLVSSFLRALGELGIGSNTSSRSTSVV